jgi:hypothetical protein
MDIDFIRLLFDFGLVVLIWLVQLVIYPSFRYYAKEDLLSWHERYTSQVTYVVFPLMTGQLLVAGMQIWQEINIYTLASACLITLLWLSTFLQFVPLHNRISADLFHETDLNKLVRLNWMRTVLWTALFLWSAWHTF